MRQIKKPWGGRFSEETDLRVERFTASVGFDLRLLPHDIRGSIVHCRALGKARLLKTGEVKTIVKGLEAIRKDFERGRIKVSEEVEDVHMLVERELIRRVGDVGRTLHTGRSRNDQVSLDTRLYMREAIGRIRRGIGALKDALVGRARDHEKAILPGYTHLQRAQPVLFAHHLLAYVEMLNRDDERFAHALGQANVMPLGSGALAGSNFPLNRRLMAVLLGFPAVTKNSMDAVSDRDFIVEFLAAAALSMVHLSRLAEEMILWSTREFGFVELPDAFCTGSSMMPQKKNPDVPELVRGKTGRVIGDLVALLTVLKSLPLTYNRDLQEDKEALFDAEDTLAASLELMAGAVDAMRVDERAMARALDGSLLATELADYLVTKKIPFRTAHAIVGRLVRHAQETGESLTELSLDDLRKFSPKFGPDVVSYLKFQESVDRKAQIGGTASRQVSRRLRELTRGRSRK